MTLSDFPRGIARVSEGFCPLCDGELEQMPDEIREHALKTFPAQTDALREIFVYSVCPEDMVGWALDTSMGASQPMLRPSRELTQDEMKRLYNRSEEA